jgi:hypothetical protein
LWPISCKTYSKQGKLSIIGQELHIPSSVATFNNFIVREGKKEHKLKIEQNDNEQFYCFLPIYANI